MDKERCIAEGIRYIEKQDPDYPEILQYYDRMPAGLYVKGNLPDPEKKIVAMVGARNCSSYGRNQAMQFAESLAREGVQIISGLAYGIDAYAHRGALKGGGKTYAILGCGVDVCYPKDHYLLYEEILKTGGGILSEFELGTAPLPWHFPIRNRIISGLADIVLVVEARKKSGSLITADYALEQGKTIFAVPGRVGDACSTGCNALIAQGAGIAWSPDVLLEELFSGWKKDDTGADCETEENRKLQRLSEDEKTVFHCLDETEQSLAAISRESGFDSRKTTTILTMLCMEGLAVNRVPGYYCRSEKWRWGF